MVVPGMLAGVNEVYVGFAATEAVDANTTVTISISGNNQVVTRSHTFSASSSAPEIDNTLTGISIKLDEAYGSYYTAFNDYLLFKDGFTDPNPNVTAEEGHDGRSMVLHAVRSPIGATDVVTWSSSPEGIVEFQTSNDGSDCTVIAKAVGDAIVTASAGSFSASVPVRVVSTTYSVNSTSYNTLSDAIVAAGDSETISVKGSASIAGVYVADGATVTAASDDAVQSTNSTATVTPKTLTIANGANQKTAKAYVVSSGEGGNEKKAVVTNVAKDGTFTNETSSTSVESYVNVAKVLANAVAEKSIDVSSISSMELSLKKTDNATLPTAVSEKVAENEKTVTFEVHPIATVKTTVGTTTTETTYDVSNEELAANASFTFKLTGLTAGKSYTLYHYSGEGELKDTFYKTADANGEVTLTLSSFSYIVGEEIANPETINAVYMSNLSLKESLNLNFYIKLADGVDKSNAVAKVTFNGITTEHPLSDASTVTLYGNTTYKVSQTVVARMMFKTAVLELYVNGEKVPLAKYTGETTAEYVGTAYTDSVDAFLTRYASQYANDSLAVDLANATRAYGTAARAKLTDN